MSDDASSERRPRLVVALTFAVFPARGGGQVRVLHLYRELARWFEVDLVCLVAADGSRPRESLAPGLREHTIPKTAEHAASRTGAEEAAGTVVTDVAMIRLHALTPSYGATIGRLAAGARAVVACHPYAYEAIRAATDVPLWYEAQDIETTLKEAIIGGDGVGARCWRTSHGSSARARLKRSRYGRAAPRTGTPWSTSTVRRRTASESCPMASRSARSTFTDWSRRAQLRADLRLPAFGQMLFIGSWHEPNILAAHASVDAAREAPDVEFLILGSVGLALDRRWLPINVRLLGTVEERFKETVLSVASRALNPMTTGSGTNLKMVEYFAAGTPVVSTAFGARGLGVEPGEHYVAAEPWSFAAGIRQLAEMDGDRIATMTAAARTHVERHLSWEGIATSLVDALTGEGILSVR